MNKVTRRLITSVCMLGASYAGAQTTFYVDGLARAQITNERLDGDVIATDTVGGVERLEKINTGGYTLLDLGFNLEKNEKFYLNTILRGRDEFGLFWGDGTSFEFRKITMGGLIGKGIKYELGDIYVGMSPYTVYNADVDFDTYESEIFSSRREIVEYENFIKGNDRFLQGIKAAGNLLFTKGIEKLELKGFTTRTSSIQETGEADVLMAGASANAIQGKYGELGVNFVSLFDLPVSTNTQRLRSSVVSFNLNPKYDINPDMTVGINSEIGGSNYLIETDVQDEFAFSGMFVDAEAYFDFKKYKAKATIGYRVVDSEFRSPGAQTRRINVSTNSQIFDSVSVNTLGTIITRDQAYYDRFTQENIYQGGVNYALGLFNPAFDNVTPYGKATPNRKGITAKIQRGDEKDVWQVTAEFSSLQEIISYEETTDGLRNFLAINAGGQVDVGRILDIKRRLSISGSYQSESTTRTGDESIDLTSSVIDFGASLEVLKKFDLMAGFKSFSAVGNEYSTTYATNNFTKLVPAELEYNSSEDFISIGGRLRFTDKAALTLNYNLNAFNNDLTDDADNFNINQFFVNYSMKF